MEVILLERVAKLGQMGEVVRVKDGFARNFLLPKGKALRATEANKARFETMKADLQAQNLASKGEADKVGSKLDGKRFGRFRRRTVGSLRVWQKFARRCDGRRQFSAAGIPGRRHLPHFVRRTRYRRGTPFHELSVCRGMRRRAGQEFGFFASPRGQPRNAI